MLISLFEHKITVTLAEMDFQQILSCESLPLLWKELTFQKDLGPKEIYMLVLGVGFVEGNENDEDLLEKSIHPSLLGCFSVHKMDTYAYISYYYHFPFLIANPRSNRT